MKAPKPNLSEYFFNAEKAEEFITKLLWAKGSVCPHCGNKENIYTLTAKEGSKTSRKSLKLYKCSACRKQFTITMGTIFQDSHIPLNKWLYAFHLLCSSKKGMSAHQLHRMLDVAYRSAWFMAHRIRLAMSQEPLASKLFGIIEADETYIGARTKRKGDKRKLTRGRGTERKVPVFSLVERGGNVRSQKVENISGKNLKGIIRANVEKSSHIMTDEFPVYNGLEKEFAKHDTVDHGREQYVNGLAYTNTAENFFSLLKRGIVGVYHHVSRQHLDLYLHEFDFRYSERKTTDHERTIKALGKVVGKRLKLTA